MKTTGKVIDLFTSLKGEKNRFSKNELVLDENGILGDKFYEKDISRSILISSIDSYTIAKENSIVAPFGSLGENIILDINPYILSSGDQIEIGEVTVEITQNCTICNSLAKVDPKLPNVLKNDRGIFAKTVKNGRIRKGDNVNILKH
jgi:MOSC domain-containing protein YiiM